jgi:hypothetical protein
MPLGMEHTTFQQPLPNDLMPKMSKGYLFSNGEFIAQPFEIVTVYPAGSLSATSTDMAKFMIAHLNDGHYGGEHILQEKTAQEMHEVHFTGHSHFPGVCYGFYEMNRSVIGHGGDTFLFHSLLVLFPQVDIGFFVSYNSQTAIYASNEFLSSFLEKYFSTPTLPPLQPLPNFKEHIIRYTGEYLTNRRPYTSVDKVLLFPDYNNYIIKITANPNGTLQVFGSTFVEVEPLLFVEVSHQVLMLAFVEDEQGQISHMYSGSSVIALEKLKWYETSTFQYGIFVFCAIVFLSALIIWTISAIHRKLRRKEPNLPNLRRARLVASGESLLHIIFVILMFVVMLNRLMLGDAYYTFLTLVLIIPLFSCGLAIITVIFTVLAWWGKGNPDNRPYWKIWGRLHYSIVSFAGVAFILDLIFWNLLGFNF